MGQKEHALDLLVNLLRQYLERHTNKWIELTGPEMNATEKLNISSEGCYTNKTQ